jgi:ribosomal protein L37AE/L43A
MTKRTKKVGVTGKYGTRYAVHISRNAAELGEQEKLKTPKLHTWEEKDNCRERMRASVVDILSNKIADIQLP